MYLPSYSDSASMIRQSAPSRTAAAPTSASPAGWLPYTYCQAQTLSPLACRASTTDELNCDHRSVPSPDLISSVPIP